MYGTNGFYFFGIKYNNYFLKEVKINSEWVMVVDLDEFMYARNGYKTIPEYLDNIDKSNIMYDNDFDIIIDYFFIEKPKPIIKSKHIEITLDS